MSTALTLATLFVAQPAPAPAPAPAQDNAQVSQAPTPAPAEAADTPAADVAAPTLQDQPLPEAPQRVDPGSLDVRAWRGRGFFQINLGAMVPLAGERPGAGTVASAGGGVQLGWRIKPVLALGVGLTTFLHDHGETVATDSAGNTVEVRDFGRLTLFDPVFVRFFVPTRRRVEPRFDVGALLGSYGPPLGESPTLAGGVRFGAGLDVWIGPSFSLDFGVDPRVIVVEGAAGLTLQAGMGATVHW